jgi:hypothetical protein
VARWPDIRGLAPRRVACPQRPPARGFFTWAPTAEVEADGARRLTPGPPAVLAMNWTARLGAVVCRLMFSLRPRNRDAIQHLSDEQMRLGCREVLAYDLVIEKEAKHRAAVAGRLSLVGDPLDQMLTLHHG